MNLDILISKITLKPSAWTSHRSRTERDQGLLRHLP